MVAGEFIKYAKDLCVANYLGVEDFADKCNFLWNVMVLLVCVLIVTVRGYFMEAIVCYIPTKLDGYNMEGYLTNLCWVEGTYPVNLSQALPDSDKEWDKLKPTLMNYYQWVPFVLALQAIMFYIPRLVWQIFASNYTGVDLQNVVTMAGSASKETGEAREKAVNNIVSTLEELLFDRRNFRTGKWAYVHRKIGFLPGKRQGNNILASYICIKILYAVVGVMQLILMYHFLRFDSRENFFFFGYRILKDISEGKTWDQTLVFPRVGVCRHPFHLVTSIPRMFAQCVLPINMLNEKIYVFLFFYLSAILMMTLMSIPLWIWRTAFLRRQTHFIRRFLKMSKDYDYQMAHYSLERREVHRFVEEFLRQDGHFLIRILSMNAGDIITKDIVNSLFEVYRKRYADKDFRNCYAEPDFMSVKIENGGQAVTKRQLSSSTSPSAPIDEKSMLYNFIEKTDEV